MARFADMRIERGLRTRGMRSVFGTDDVHAIWADLAARPYATNTERRTRVLCETICPGEAERVNLAAQQALGRRVSLLGSGIVDLGRPIDWLRDPKSGVRWARAYAPRMNYAELDRPSDVKMPWELSRLQWLIPVGQTYLLSGDEELARATRRVFEEWIAANPYAFTVNWAIAMEPALRILTWTWFFHVFARSEAWTDREFRERFLSTLFAHADFVERHLERSDVNGNHYLSNAAGLVFAGLFFGDHPRARRWATVGWGILTSEFPQQVHADGVDFESSTAYHRLVTELFLLPALYMTKAGLELPASYRERLGRMGGFVAAYSRPDGSAPFWGDADDGRALPFGSQSLNDHRYLIGLVAHLLSDDALAARATGPRAEAFWLLGEQAAADVQTASTNEGSAAFPNAGVYVLRHESSHLFVDCGPVGFGGRGGHGHNDCLSFELMLLGTALIIDAGTFVYTASRDWRNRFRGTSFHNTPIVDEVEQNRLIHPDFLWSLHDDAQPLVRVWRSGAHFDVLSATHSGYMRLPRPVRPIRRVVLDKMTNRVVVHDRFVGRGEHSVRIPFHFSSGVRSVDLHSDHAVLEAGAQRFVIAWRASAHWTTAIRDSWASPSYGVKVATRCLEFSRTGELQPLVVLVTSDPDLRNVSAAMRELMRAREFGGAREAP